MSFDKAFPILMQKEGGFANHVFDRGGATNKGITLANWIKHGRDLDGDGDIDIEDLKRLKDSDAYAFYKKLYWDYPKIERYPGQLQLSLFDMYVNAGANAFGILAEAGGWPWKRNYAHKDTRGNTVYKTDAKGNIIFWNDEAFIELAKKISLESYTQARINYYKAIAQANPTQNAFLKGWIERANDIAQLGKKFITENPGTTAAIAITVGTGLFFLMRSFSSSDKTERSKQRTFEV